MTETKKRATAFSADERAAMKDHSQELKSAARRGSKASKADGEGDLLEKIAEMTPADKELAERLHAIITATAPDLEPKTWYGMPAYAKDGALVCHFQPAQKFKTRYATLGFSDKASLDDGALWPVAYALTELTPAAEAKVVGLIKKALKG